MKTYAKEPFSLAASDLEYLNNSQDKIELVSCNGGDEAKCKEHLFVINKSFHNCDSYRKAKLFQLSIEELRNAYFKTFELSDKSCLNCSKLFRSTIVESLHNLKDELHEMTSGFFGNKHYELGYKLAEKVLNEIEKEPLLKKEDKRKTKERYIESYPEKIVS